MSQPIFTPDISKCPKCGADANAIDWDYKMMYRVMCDKCSLILTKECCTRHRAICKWNNKCKEYVK